MKPQPHRLKLTSLKFISSVDVPAQETATARLLKRKGPAVQMKRKGESLEVKGTARVAKLSDELGLVFGWAITTKANHVDYIDLQGDNVVEEDLIKVAAEWMSAGGAADTMHDRQQDGSAVFCMPMTYEVAKAFFGDKIGGELGTYGLMVAIKPSAEDFQKFKSGELTGFSIDGMGERTPLAKSLLKFMFVRAIKEAVLTSAADGHVHALDLDDPATSWCSMYQTSYQTSEGADGGHSHAWTFDRITGAITIGADSGHTHTVAAVVPPDVLAAWVKLDAAQDAANLATAAAPIAIDDDPSDGVPSSLPVEESSGATIIVAIEARAPKTNSTPPKPIRTVNPQPEPKPMNLIKTLALFAALAPNEQAYVTTLGDEAEAFLGKTPAERESIFKALDAADPVVFTGELTGLTVRKSHGELARKSAENAEHQAKKNALMSETLTKREEEIEKSEVRKLAAEMLAGMPGDEPTHDLIVRSLRKSGAKAEDIEKAFATLKGMRATSKVGQPAPGSTGADPHDGSAIEVAAIDALDLGLKKFCKEQGITKSIWVDGLRQFVATEAGAALKRAVDEAATAE